MTVDSCTFMKLYKNFIKNVLMKIENSKIWDNFPKNYDFASVTGKKPPRINYVVLYAILISNEFCVALSSVYFEPSSSNYVAGLYSCVVDSSVCDPHWNIEITAKD